MKFYSLINPKSNKSLPIIRVSDKVKKYLTITKL